MIHSSCILCLAQVISSNKVLDILRYNVESSETAKVILIINTKILLVLSSNNIPQKQVQNI